MPKTIQVINHASWVASELAENARYPVKLSYGLDIPVHSKNDLWWVPQAQAVRLIYSSEHWGVNTIPKFIAPSPELLAQLPASFRGRNVEVYTADEAVSVLFPWPDSFWKLATAKHDTFMPQTFQHDELVAAVAEMKLPSNSLLQRSDVLEGDLQLKKEFRLFIKLDEDGVLRVKTGSIYLDQTGPEAVTVYDGAVTEEDELVDAIDFAAAVLDSGIDFPPSFVMDVGLTSSGAWVVIEFNPSWCSAWYDCDIDAVVDVIERSFNTSASERKVWKYEPDAVLRNHYTQPGQLFKLA